MSAAHPPISKTLLHDSLNAKCVTLIMKSSFHFAVPVVQMIIVVFIILLLSVNVHVFFPCCRNSCWITNNFQGGCLLHGSYITSVQFKIKNNFLATLCVEAAWQSFSTVFGISTGSYFHQQLIFITWSVMSYGAPHRLLPYVMHYFSVTPIFLTWAYLHIWHLTLRSNGPECY